MRSSSRPEASLPKGPLAFLAALSALVWAAPLWAQGGMGGAPDGGPVIPTKESFEESLREAPWSAGAWRFQPWLGVRDASFVSDQVTSGNGPTGTGADTSQASHDFTVTAGAGLRAYLPKSKLVFTAHALPEYVWWQDSDDKRHLNGRYGAALFGYFNRLRFELSGRLIEQQGFFSRELQQLTSTRQLISNGQVELDLARGITLFSYANATSIDGNEDDFAVFRSLDRDDRNLGLGLRLFSPRGWTAHLAFEDSSSEFAADARDLSNDGTSVEVGLGYQHRRIDARLTVRFEDIEPTGASALTPYSEAGGGFQLLYQPGERLEMAAYGSRAFEYSIDPQYSHYITEIYGLRGRLKSKRGSFGVFAALGQDEFVALADGAGRLDDVTEIGAQLDFQLRRLFLVAVNVLRRDYDSDLDLYDRNVTSFGLSVQLGELAERLRLGSDRSAW